MKLDFMVGLGTDELGWGQAGYDSVFCMCVAVLQVQTVPHKRLATMDSTEPHSSATLDA